MKKLSLTFITFLFTQITFSQVTFQKTYGWVKYYTTNFNTIKTLDNSFIISAWHIDSLSSDTGLNVIKYDPSFNIQWSKQYYLGGCRYPSHMASTRDSGYIFAGSMPLLYTNSGINLLKTDKDGNIQWSYKYCDTIPCYDPFVVQTADNGFLISAISDADSGVTYLRDIVLLKTDSSGNLQWSKRYSGNGFDIFKQMLPTADNGCIITGNTTSFGAGFTDIFLLKTDSLGDTTWTATYGTSVEEVTSCIMPTTDSAYVICGTMRSNFSTDVYNTFILKTSLNGSIQWSKTLDASPVSDNVYGITEAGNGNYVLAGSYQLLEDAPYKDGVAHCITSTGNTVWSKVYIYNAMFQELCSVKQTDDGGFLFNGYSHRPSSPKIDWHVIKTDSTGNSGCYDSSITTTITPVVFQKGNAPFIISTANFIQTSVTHMINSGISETTICSTVGLNEMNSMKKYLHLYPNPNNGNFVLDYDPSFNKSITLEVFDVMGKCVYYSTLDGGSNKKQVNLNSIAKGLYVCKVGNEVIRFVKE